MTVSKQKKNLKGKLSVPPHLVGFIYESKQLTLATYFEKSNNLDTLENDLIQFLFKYCFIGGNDVKMKTTKMGILISKLNLFQ